MPKRASESKALSERALERARSRLTILPGRPDPEGLLALARIVFPGEDISDPRFLPWLYDWNPRGPAHEAVTVDRGLITGHMAVVPLRFKIGAATVSGGLAVNAITHPDFRGKGIFIVVHDELNKICGKAGLEFTFGYANSNSYKGCLRHLDYREIGRFPLWILPFDMPRIIAAHKSTQGWFWRATARAANPLVRLGQAVLRPRRSGPFAIERISEFGPEFDAFWETVKDDYTNILVRDRAFLSWRFVRPPTRRYKIFAARSEGRLAGYLVGGMTTIEGLRWGMIVDLLTARTPEGRAASRHLIAAFSRDARSEGADLAATLMLKHAPAAKALRRNGYLVCPKNLLPREFPILLHWNMDRPAPAGLFDPNSWFITMGDCDTV
jgi:hypothetical protein